MLKKRIIPVVLIKNGIVVQSIGFNKYLPVGKPEIAVDFLNQWGADEISVVDMDATRNGKIDFEALTRISQKCLVPITYGGGIQNTEAMVRAVQAGADKVMINSAILKEPKLITEGAKLLGEQCIVVSVDAKKDSDGVYKAYDHLARKVTAQKVLDTCLVAQESGAGEIFLNSVDHDGSKKGFDLKLAEEICSKLKIPITICGGANHPDDFAAALKIKNISGVAAANFFQYTEHSVTVLKSYLKKHTQADLRLDSYCTYNDTDFLKDGRLARKSDDRLKELLFEYHKKEVI